MRKLARELIFLTNKMSENYSTPPRHEEAIGTCGLATAGLGFQTSQTPKLVRKRPDEFGYKD